MKTKFLILLMLSISLLVSWTIGNADWENAVTKKEQGSAVPLPFDSLTNKLLKVACLDCHSHETEIPFYARFYPVSDFTLSHVKVGRSELNLSKWESLRSADRVKACKGMIQEIEKQSMPLNSYMLLHPDARLDEHERDHLINEIKAYLARIKTDLLMEVFSGNSLRIRTRNKDTTLTFSGHGRTQAIELGTSPLLRLDQNQKGQFQLYFAESREDAEIAITQPAKAIYQAYMCRRPAIIIYCLADDSAHHLIVKELNTFQDHRLFSSADSVYQYQFHSITQ